MILVMNAANRTWVPTAAGVVQIVSAVTALTGAVAMLVALGIILSIQHSEMHDPGDEFGLALAASLLGAFAACTAILGVLALVGGLSTLRRKSFGWALTGAIASIFCLAPLGIAALILVVVGQSEFGGRATPADEQPPNVG